MILILILLQLSPVTCSWYGGSVQNDEFVPGYFHNRQTASGLIYDAYSFTCAHKNLPLGTVGIFIAPQRVAISRVTDRGPFITGREFDCSAQLFNFLSHGDLDKGVAEFYFIPLFVYNYDIPYKNN